MFTVFLVLQEKDLPDYACLCFTDNWVKCDDDKMSNVTSEDILKLSGGGKCLSGGTTPISLDNEDMAGGDHESYQ